MSRKKPAEYSDCHCDLNRDLSLAGKLQQMLLPRSSPVCSWCCIGIKNRMAQGLGGDFYDFLEMPDGCQALFIGDVTGHGPHASIVMSLIYGYIHGASLERCEPLAMVNGVNRLLRSYSRRSTTYDYLFSTTLFFAVIQPESLKMHYINCGHVPPLVRRGEELFRFGTTGPPLGFFEQPEIAAGSFAFRPGDRLLMYTDGISEAVNAAGEEYGRGRVEAALMELDGDHLEFLETADRCMRDFGCALPPADDCTAIVLDIHSFQSEGQSRHAE